LDCRAAGPAPQAAQRGPTMQNALTPWEMAA